MFQYLSSYNANQHPLQKTYLKKKFSIIFTFIDNDFSTLVSWDTTVESIFSSHAIIADKDRK